MTVISSPAASDGYCDGAGQRFAEATLHWYPWTHGEEQVRAAEGAEFAPGDVIGVLYIGDVVGPFSGRHPIFAETFGRITKVLVSDGSSVRPNEPLLEFDDRPVTEAEYVAQRRRADEAEHELRKIHDSLRLAIEAWWRHRRWRKKLVKEALRS